MNYLLGLGAIGRDDLAVVGGKGANLGELVRAGLPVPPGLVLSTAAYLDFVDANDLGDRIRELAGSAAAAVPAAVADASARIRELFTQAGIPDAMAKEIVEGYRTLGVDGPAGDGPEGSAAGVGPAGTGSAGVGSAGVGPAVAVRSSATAEDLPDASFAGQQETYLNVRGPDALLDAVRRCWASLWTARALAYRDRQGIDPATVSLAVVVQTMVEAEAAGVLFTANPANGRRDEVVIGAAWGLGEAVVSGLVSTDDLVVDKASGRVLSRRVADKAVSTVYLADGGTAEVPVAQDKRREAVLDDAAAAELAGIGARVEEHFGAPQDIEWARVGGRFYLVQSRPITALPQPASDPPTDWSVPDPRSFYFRASIVEQLPDPLSPLFADLAGPSVTRSLRVLMEAVMGSGRGVGLVTVNGYAYYRYTRAAMWRAIGRSPLAVRLLRGDNTAHAGVRGWRDHSHPRYQRAVAAWAARRLDELPSTALLGGVRELLDAGTTYYTAVQSIIPIAATSEIAFTAYYDRLVRWDGDPPAPVFLLGFDSLPILAEKSLYDLARWTGERDGLAEIVRGTPAAALAGRLGGAAPDGVDDELWRQWATRFREHLDRYGHTVYNLDFVNAVPSDDPAPPLDALKLYLRGGGSDPYQRQRAAVERRERATETVRARLDRPRLAVFDRLLRWAQRAAPIREDALADVGLAWPVMRRMLLEVGARLATAGMIDKREDVFWLREGELAGLAADHDAGHPATGPRDAVERRKMLWRGRRRATPPQLLPVGGAKFWERFMPAGSEDQTGDVIRGTSASAGQVTAPARVLAGPEDFARMQPGDVLVASITTPAWTTLFAMASGVVTDVGGPLSHSSIVAREYGIPAVLGTAVATRRIRDGQRVRVDGDAGTVTLLPGP